MNQSSDRIQCPHCGANNFMSSSECWQCKKPLRSADAEGPTPPPEQPAPGGYQAPPPYEQPYQAAPQPPPGGQAYGGQVYGAPQQSDSKTNTLVILGAVFAGATLLPSCCGWPFFIASLTLGIIAWVRGNSAGRWVVLGAVIAFMLNTAYSLKMGKQYMDQMGGLYGSGKGGQSQGMPKPNVPFPKYDGPLTDPE